MSGLDQMSTRVDADDTCSARTRDFGHLLPILHQIRHALERLVTTGEETRIDLQSMPFGPGDLALLTAQLGTGEVTATVDALGPTQVRETAIPGVWLVDYQNSDTQRLSLQIEIAPVPAILRPQPLDLAGSLAMLDAHLERLQGQGDSNQPLLS